MRGVAAADDIVPDMLLRAWLRWGTFDPEKGTPTGWLLAITRIGCAGIGVPGVAGSPDWTRTSNLPVNSRALCVEQCVWGGMG